MSRRREPRVEIDLAVKVWGFDLYGNTFVQHARTINATRAGARLIGIDCVKAGEVISIQHGERKSRFRVVWVGRENTPKAQQIGVHCLDTETSLFSLERLSLASELADFPAATLETEFEDIKQSYL